MLLSNLGGERVTPSSPTTSSNSNFLLNTPSPDTTPLELMASTYGFGVITVQTITDFNISEGDTVQTIMTVSWKINNA